MKITTRGAVPEIGVAVKLATGGARVAVTVLPGDVLLPALYPNSHAHADDAVKLGRATDWTTPAEGLTHGIGAKTFLIGDAAAGLLEWRELLIA